MKRSIVGLLGLGMLLVSATAADAQLTNFPTYAVPSSFGMPTTFLSVDFGRGLNELSGKQNAFGVALGRSGMGDRVNVVVGAGMITYDPDSKYTFGGDVGIDLLAADSDVQIGVQAGVGYISIADGYSTTTVPIGVAVKGSQAGESANFGWWFMPRLQYTRASFSGLSDSSSDFGASAGASISMSSGFGIHAAIDLLAADNNVWGGGIGAHYAIN
jgi:hypothetical protein